MHYFFKARRDKRQLVVRESSGTFARRCHVARATHAQAVPNATRGFACHTKRHDTTRHAGLATPRPRRPSESENAF